MCTTPVRAIVTFSPEETIFSKEIMSDTFGDEYTSPMMERKERLAHALSALFAALRRGEDFTSAVDRLAAMWRVTADELRELYVKI